MNEQNTVEPGDLFEWPGETLSLATWTDLTRFVFVLGPGPDNNNIEVSASGKVYIKFNIFDLKGFWQKYE